MILLRDHSFGCEPGDSGSGGISLFKIFIEFGNKVRISPQGDGACQVDGVFSEGGGPGES